MPPRFSMWNGDISLVLSLTPNLKFFYFVFGCAGSSFMHAGFLELQQVRAALPVAALGLLIAVAPLVGLPS